MYNITDKIRSVIEAKNINKTKFSEQIGVARDYVYKMSDDTLKVSTLIQISEVLEIPIVNFFTKQKDKNDIFVVNEPQSEYGNKDNEIKYLKNKVSDLTEMNAVLKDQVKLCKELLKKNS